MVCEVTTSLCCLKEGGAHGTAEQSARTFTACRDFLFFLPVQSSSTSKTTLSPLARNPRWHELPCTKISELSASHMMNPYPAETLNHFTVPYISDRYCLTHAVCCARSGARQRTSPSLDSHAPFAY